MPEACKGKGRGGEPCCWHAADGQHMVPRHLDVLCCFCAAIKCVEIPEEQKHGLYATRLLVPEEYLKAYKEAGK